MKDFCGSSENNGNAVDRDAKMEDAPPLRHTVTPVKEEKAVPPPTKPASVPPPSAPTSVSQSGNSNLPTFGTCLACPLPFVLKWFRD